jgi:hypothetical protein
MNSEKVKVKGDPELSGPKISKRFFAPFRMTIRGWVAIFSGNTKSPGLIINRFNGRVFVKVGTHFIQLRIEDGIKRLLFKGVYKTKNKIWL